MRGDTVDVGSSRECAACKADAMRALCKREDESACISPCSAEAKQEWMNKFLIWKEGMVH